MNEPATPSVSLPTIISAVNAAHCPPVSTDNAGSGALIEEVRAAQRHGRTKYGSGPDDLGHDDRTPEERWHDYIKDHNERAKAGTPMERRAHLVKVAGLALSAIEAFDRKNRSI